MILGIIGFILNILALYGWFTGNYIFVYIGGIFTLIVDIIGLYEGTNRTVFWSIVLPILVGLFFFDASIAGACVGISLISAIFFILGIIVMAFGAIGLRKSNNKPEKKSNLELSKKDEFDNEEEFECDNCGTKVKSDAEECPKCGAIFVEADEEEKDIDDEETVYNCNNCGAEVDESAEECPKCGASFIESGNSSEKNEEELDMIEKDKAYSCSKCGIEVEKTAKECPKCGATFIEGKEITIEDVVRYKNVGRKEKRTYVSMFVTSLYYYCNNECVEVEKILSSNKIKNYDYFKLHLGITAFISGIWISCLNISEDKMKELENELYLRYSTSSWSYRMGRINRKLKTSSDFVNNTEEFINLYKYALKSANESRTEKIEFIDAGLSDDCLCYFLNESAALKIKSFLTVKLLGEWYVDGKKASVLLNDINEDNNSKKKNNNSKPKKKDNDSKSKKNNDLDNKKTNEAIQIMKKTYNEAVADLDGQTEEDVLYLYNTHKISAEKRDELIDSIRALQMIVDTYPSLIENLEKNISK